MTFFRTLLAGLALLLTACGRDDAGPQAEPPAHPALWRAADADTTVYLFGSIHMLPPGATWRSEAVDRALAEAGVVYFEADVQAPVNMQRDLVERLGRVPIPRRLSDDLSAEQSSALGVAAARLGVARTALETMRPWYAAVVISDAAIRAAGYSSDAGADAQLRKSAEAAGKELRYLETIEYQLLALSDLPQDVQLAYLDLTLADIEDVRDDLALMFAAWRSGDTDALARVLIDEDMARLPELKIALLTRRNANWTSHLDALLTDEPGVFFVAVGAAHLVGNDSVVHQLAALGRKVERVQ